MRTDRRGFTEILHINVATAAQAAGATEIVVLTISSATSGTYQTSQQTAQWVKGPVHVIDSKSPTMSLGWQTLAAARARGWRGHGGHHRRHMVNESGRCYRPQDMLHCLQPH